MPFKNNNVVHGLPENGTFQVGKSNFDDGVVAEKDISVPWMSSPTGSYLYYDCTVEVVLDSGIVVHNHLPQRDTLADTLSSVIMESAGADKVVGPGVNLKSLDYYSDITQRMAHSRYWFHLFGQALRVGYRVPIPGIKLIGGVAAVPHDDNPQRAFNRILPGGNFGGVILWHARWSLWYTTILPPRKNDIPEVDMAAHIRGTAPIPVGIQSPFTRPDDDAETVQLQGFPVQQ